MPLYTRLSPVAAPAEALFAWHARPGAFERLTPPWMDVEVERHDGVAEGSRSAFRLRVGPVPVRWEAEHRDVEEGRGFTDVQVEGPFAEWAHVHRFLPAGPGHAVLEDAVTYRLPFHTLGGLAEGAVERRLDRAFAYRHRVTAADLERHGSAGLAPTTVLVTGSTGLLGKALVAFLLSGGHRVVRLVRDRRIAARTPKRPGERLVYWNVERGEVDEDRLRRAAPEAVVHLAGESLYGVWTAAKRRRMWESRVKGTHLLARALARMPRPPRVLLSASATGVYGDAGDAPLDEHAAPGRGFLADLTRAWEEAADAAREAGVRVVHPRIGIVLSPAGGALGLGLPAARAGLSGWPGAGDPFVPWVALDDVLYAFLHLLARDVRGPVNVTAPEPARLRELVRAVGGVLGRPTPLRVPGGLVHALGGRMARETLASARAVPARLLGEGFTFQYPHLDGALRHLLGRTAEDTEEDADL